MALRIGEAAEAAGVRIQTLHYYERRGILAPARRGGSGYRSYDDADVSLIRAIKRAQNLGFTLREIEELIRLREGDEPSVDLVSLANAKIAEIDQKLRDLRKVRRTLEQLVDSCACGGDASRCDVMVGLGASPVTPNGEE